MTFTHNETFLMHVTKTIKSILRRIPYAGSIKRFIRTLVINQDQETLLNINAAFPAFTPNSAGSYIVKATLTIAAINATFPSLASLLQTLNVRIVQERDISTFPISDEDHQAAHSLKIILDREGSDKASYHNYHKFYGPILRKLVLQNGILEIGLGTNNTNVVSNMGSAGRPGASLRAWRAYLEKVEIFGADIDQTILFREERIQTFFVDQNDRDSFIALGAKLPPALDLIIDDGLHSPHANVETLRFGLARLSVGGWMVVEDIVTDAVPMWRVVAALLPTAFESQLLRAQGGYLFAARRLC